MTLHVSDAQRYGDSFATRDGASAATPLPGKLQLTKGYAVDFDKLARLLGMLCAGTRGRIPMTDVAVALGLANAHAEHLCSIAQALGLVARITYKPTALGRLVREHDPFFDDVGTLWFLHYTIASDPRVLIWHRVVTVILPGHRSITRDNIRTALDDLRDGIAERSRVDHDRNVTQELRVVLDAYLNQHLSRLDYLRPAGDLDSYVLGHGVPLAPLILGASIVRFRARHRATASALAVADLLQNPDGPAVVFQLGEEDLRAALESLKTQPGLSLESRADLDQVRLGGESAETWMERYYAGR